MPRRYTLGKRETAVAQTRRGIANALLRLMAQAPYDSIALKQIAREADVAERTVNRHFASKHAILVAHLEGVTNAEVRARVWKSVNGGDPRSAIEQVVRAVFEAYEGREDEIWPVINTEASSKEFAEYRASVKQFQDRLASSVVNAWPEAWRFDRERTRQMLSGVLRFLAWDVLRKECGLSLEESVFAITEVVTRLLMKQGAREEKPVRRTLG